MQDQALVTIHTNHCRKREESGWVFVGMQVSWSQGGGSLGQRQLVGGRLAAFKGVGLEDGVGFWVYIDYMKVFVHRKWTIDL